MNFKRLSPHGRISVYRTLAILSPGVKEKKSKVNLPSEDAVERAKAWIDEHEA